MKYVPWILAALLVICIALYAQERGKNHVMKLVDENARLNMNIQSMGQMINIAAQDSSVVEQWVAQGLVTLEQR